MRKMFTFPGDVCGPCANAKLIPPSPVADGCCISTYASGTADMQFTRVGGDWEVVFSTADSINASGSFVSFDWEWRFWQGGVQVDSDSAIGFVVPQVVTIPDAGAGVYVFIQQFEFSDGGMFFVTKFVEVDGAGNIVRSVSVTSIQQQGAPDCRTVTIEGDYSTFGAVTILAEQWFERIGVTVTQVGTGMSLTYTLQADPETFIFFALLLDTAQWPDVDFTLLALDGIYVGARYEVVCDEVGG